MLEAGDVPDGLSETVAEIRELHSFDSGLPSIYRCLAQWPGYLEPAWADLEPVLESEAFERGCHDADAVVDDHLERLPYTPRLSPDDLEEQGFDDGTIDELQTYVRGFNRGAVGMVLQTIVTYAATLDASGERTL